MVYARFTGKTSLSFSDIIIISGRQISDIKPDDVDLGLYITEDLYMPLSWFSAAMQCVSDAELGVALAQYGGCVVLPRSVSIEEQVRMGKEIKKRKAGFNYDVITVSPDKEINELIKLQEKTDYSSFPVVDNDGKLIGLITEKKYHPRADVDKKIYERMIKLSDLVTGEEDISLKDANEKLLKKGIGTLPIVDKNGKYICSVFWSDIKKHVDFPNEFVDDKGRYRYAAAISTFEDDIERMEELVKNAECDIIVIDTADIKSDYAEEMIKTCKSKFPEIPLIAGNAVDKEGFILAAEAGADCVKGGQGPGLGCTTRVVKGTGRGTVTEIIELAKARDGYKRTVSVIHDGGMSNTDQFLKAYACGADGLMMGSYFGGFTESSGPLILKSVHVDLPEYPNIKVISVEFKEYWGEASKKALNIQRYGYKTIEGFGREGAEGVIPHKGSIHDTGKEGILLHINFIKKSLSESGAKNVQEYPKRAKLDIQSLGSQYEGRPW